MHKSFAAKSTAVESDAPAAYLPSLDGLRFFAFLLVFFSHVSFGDSPLLGVLTGHGWVGVEIFFAVSSFLFFHLLKIEKETTGSINIPNFFWRRLLRIYPLMMLFPILMLFFFGPLKPDAWARLGGLAFFVDNYVTAFRGYNTSVAFSDHLWTLPYEFQIYVVIPLLFLIYQAMGPRRFLVLLLVIWLICAGARMVFVGIGVNHPVIWVIPFLRPESVLAGIILSLGVLNFVPVWLVCAALTAATCGLILGPNVFVAHKWNLFLYPICAIFSGSLVWLAGNAITVSRFFALTPIRFLGKISFGLYVYHLLALDLAKILLSLSGIIIATYSVLVGVQCAIALAITIILASVSYFLFERPFLRLKARYSVIRSRPI